MSPSSPQALYHPIPQAPVASNPVLRRSDVELDADDAADSNDSVAHRPAVSVNSRIRWIYFIMGCAVLLPWNVMITATPYFLSRLASSPLKQSFSSYLSTSFTAANFAFLAHATATSKQTSPSRQIIITLICLSILTFILTLSTFIRVSSGVFFTFVLLNGIAQAALGSYLQTSVIAVASLFGPTAVQAMMSGQAAVAVAVSGVQVLSAVASTWGEAKSSAAAAAAEREAEESSAFIFFSLSTLFLLATALAQRWLMTMPAYRAVAGALEPSHKTDADDETREESQGLVGDRNDGPVEKNSILRVAKANLTYEIAVAYVFVVTLAVFPPITISIQSTNPSTHPLLFSAVHFLIFGSGDFLGRYLCSFPKLLIWSARRLLTISLARTFFIPLFLMCNVQRPSTTLPSTPIISSDFLFMLILLAFGMSNGYVSSLCMMSAPSLEHNPRLRGRREDVDVAATVASFCLVGGLALGSVASFAVRGVVCGCNPFNE